MNRWWRSLRARLLLAHVLVVCIAIAAFGIASLIAAPRILATEIAHVGPMMAGVAGRPGAGQGPAMMAAVLDEALTDSYRRAVTTSLLIGSGVALLTAVGVSFLVASWLAGPLRSFVDAAQEIAGGRYDKRVASNGVEELDRLADAYNTLATVLAATEQRRAELVADVAHELRTPLSTLSGYLEGMADGVIAPTDETWAMLKSETRRMERLAGDLHQLSRADAHEIDLQSAPVAPAELFDLACKAVAAEAQSRNHTLHCEISPALPNVLADRDRAVQILTNILSNALRYTPSPGNITISAQQHHGGIAFSVQDSGLGITPDDLPRIFERFYRADKSRSREFGGSGIGLTIARAYAEAMNGQLTANSAGIGHGSTFTLWLPLAEATS